ncbi:DUF1758 domain-containing protein [Trichonephila clavipes]|nr:DUF1758 domain-containing protein [Trichonephila clavipes]
MQLAKFKGKINWENVDSTACQLFIEKYELFSNQLKRIFDELFNLCEETDIDKFVKEQLNIQERIDDIILELKRENKKWSSHSNSEVSTERISLEVVKLPKSTLPTFSGNLHDWITFKDLFKASVHNNSNLSNAQKLHLKSSLKDDAFRIIQSIAISDRNYLTVWELLEDRYSNKCEQVFAHIRRLMSLNTIQCKLVSAVLSLDDFSDTLMNGDKYSLQMRADSV